MDDVIDKKPLRPKCIQTTNNATTSAGIATFYFFIVIFPRTNDPALVLFGIRG